MKIILLNEIKKLRIFQKTTKYLNANIRKIKGKEYMIIKIVIVKK